MINSVGYLQGSNGYATTNGYAQYPYKTLPIKSDEFVNVNQEESKKKSNTKKWVIGLGLAASAAAVLLLMKGKVGGAKEQVENLFKKVDFKPATTKEEAIAFAKTHLGVENYSDKMPVEIMNWVNEGLTNVKNVTKGKAKMFKNVWYTDLTSISPLGLASTCTEGEVAGTLCFNSGNVKPGYFGNHVKNRVLAKVDKNDIFFKDVNGKIQIHHLYDNGEPAANFLKNLEEYIANPNSFSFNKEMKLYEDYCSLVNAKNSFFKAPLSSIEECFYKKDEIVKLLKAKGQFKDLSEIAKLKTPEQRRILTDMGKTCINNGIPIKVKWEPGDAFSSIYHEATHLSHDVSAGHNFHMEMGKPKECIARNGKVSDVTNEFLNTQEIQQTANKISEYASTSPAEFVAETGAAIIKRAVNGGKKLSSDIMNLFNKYKGPTDFVV